MTRRRRGQLTDDDREIWETVKKTTHPLHPGKPQSAPGPIPTINKPIAGSKAPKPLDQAPLRFSIGSKSAKTPMGHDFSPSMSDRLAQAPINMDRKKFGKMQRGKLKPEARIDLHGMTLAEAHPALNRFILGSVASGRRLVLVITGKGKQRDEGGPIPIRKGVLKNQVPNWLHQMPLRAHILQISEAHLTHGGSGAYYVYLRRHP